MYGSNNRERKEKAFNIVELERIRAASIVRKVQEERKRERGEDERQLFLQKGRSFTFSHSRGARKKDSRYRVNFSSCFHSSHSIPSLSLSLSARWRPIYSPRRFPLSRKVSLHLPANLPYRKPLFSLG